MAIQGTQIVNVFSRLALDGKDQQYVTQEADRPAYKSQRWSVTLIDEDNDLYLVENLDCQLVLAADDDTNVVLAEKRKSDRRQLWELVPVGRSYFMVNAATGKALDMPWSKDAGVKVGQFFRKEEGDNANQRWMLTPSTSTGTPPEVRAILEERGSFYLFPKYWRGASLSVADHLKTDGAPVTAWWVWYGRDYYDNSNFRFEPNPDIEGYYRIIVQHADKALQVRGNSKAPGAVIELGSRSGSESQLWSVQAVKAGYYYKIINKYSGLVLEVKDASQVENTPAQQGEWNNADHQQWSL